MFRMHPVRTSANKLAMPCEDFCGIPQSLHINIMTVSQGHDYFIPNPFQFVTRLSSCYQCSIASDTDSIANKPCKMKSSSMFTAQAYITLPLRLIAEFNNQLDQLLARYSNTTQHLEILLSQGNFRSYLKEVICC